jgi:GR25 family glycosyltransferase involved in LPS biosynthesis
MILDHCYASFINLDHRKDRLRLMQAELKKVGIKAIRQKAILPNEYRGENRKVEVMRKRTPGAIGCHFSQVEVMKKALSVNQHAFVMEDDLIFCSDFMDRMHHATKFLDSNEWDVLWLGGTYHLTPTWHKKGHPDLPQCRCSNLKDVQATDDPKIVRTYGCWSTFAYIVNVNSLPKILKLLDEHVHESMGIDWLFIRIQPQLKTFAFLPGCVKQHDNKSDIGKGMTYFSHFAKLGPHWYQDRMEDFNYNDYANKIQK